MVGDLYSFGYPYGKMRNNTLSLKRFLVLHLFDPEILEETEFLRRILSLFLVNIPQRTMQEMGLQTISL